MSELRVEIPDELKKQAEESNIDLSKLLAALVKREVLKRQLLKRFRSEEEQELTEWSIELGEKAKKDSFKRLLSKLSPKKKEELLNSMSPEKRGEYK